MNEINNLPATWTTDDYLKLQEKSNDRNSNLLDKIKRYIKIHINSISEGDFIYYFNKYNFFTYLENLLRGTTLCEIEKYKNIYINMIDIFNLLIDNKYINIFFHNNIYELIKTICIKSNIMDKILKNDYNDVNYLLNDNSQSLIHSKATDFPEDYCKKYYINIKTFRNTQCRKKYYKTR